MKETQHTLTNHDNVYYAKCKTFEIKVKLYTTIFQNFTEMFNNLSQHCLLLISNTQGHKHRTFKDFDKKVTNNKTYLFDNLFHSFVISSTVEILSGVPRKELSIANIASNTS